MNVLTTSTDPQSLNVILRSNTCDEIILTDESNNTQSIITVNEIFDKGYYTQIIANFQLVENRFYKIDIRNEGIYVYRGKIFCTNQIVENFSVNNGSYLNIQFANEFITYE